MKRILLLVSGLCFGLTFGFAQSSIEILRPDLNHVVNDSVITVNGSLPATLFITPLDVINVGAGSELIKVKRYDSLEIAPSSANYLCWGFCYAAYTTKTWMAPAAETLAVGDTDKTFTSDIRDSGNAGTYIIMYTFFNQNNVNDSAWVIIKYVIAPQGVNEVAGGNMHISAPYPNPANNMVNFNYHLTGVQDAKLEVYNTIGQCVQTMPVNASAERMNVNVSSFPSGIYICKLVANGAQPAFQRLVVTH